MTTLIGTMSTFGGRLDPCMAKDTGLALYEPNEADLRPDLFELDLPGVVTWKRLRVGSMYCALRFEEVFPSLDKNNPHDRRWLQEVPIRVQNPKTGMFVFVWIVDRGPAKDTGRLIDLSPGAAYALTLKTNDSVKVSF